MRIYTDLIAAPLVFSVTACAATQQRPTLAIEHVNVIDVIGGVVVPDQTVVISGRHISNVAPADQVRVATTTQVLDGRGRFVIPGLWDMHVHADSSDLPILVAFGITGVRDMGGDFREISRWRREIATGSQLGPRIISGGPRLVGPPKTNGPADRVVTSPADAARAVDSLAALGVDFIKIHEGIPRDAYSAIAREARARHLDFVGHVPESISPLEASDAGQKSIEHLEFIPDRCLQLFDVNVVAGKTPVTADCSSDQIHVLLGHFAANKTWLDPTISMFRAYVPPPSYQAILTGFGRIVPSIRADGIRILAGSDLSSPRMKPGQSLHDELALLADAGFSPSEVLRAATSNATQFLGISDSVGTAQRGKLADLVLLAGNPLSDIRNTQRIVAVIQNGRVVPADSLSHALKPGAVLVR